jgi:hypothetical protein
VEDYLEHHIQFSMNSRNTGSLLPISARERPQVFTSVPELLPQVYTYKSPYEALDYPESMPLNHEA